MPYMNIRTSFLKDVSLNEIKINFTYKCPSLGQTMLISLGPLHSQNCSHQSVIEVIIGPVGPMFCSSQASGSPFWISWRSRSRGYKRDIISTFMSELRLNSWHAPSKLLRNRVNKITRCYKLPKIATHSHFIRLASHLLHLSKIVILMIPHTNFWWFRTQILKYLMIPHTSFGEWSCKFSIS